MTTLEYLTLQVAARYHPDVDASPKAAAAPLSSTMRSGSPVSQKPRRCFRTLCERTQSSLERSCFGISPASIFRDPQWL